MGNSQSNASVTKTCTGYQEISNYIEIKWNIKNCPKSITQLILKYMRGNSTMWSFVDAKQIYREKINIPKHYAPIIGNISHEISLYLEKYANFINQIQNYYRIKDFHFIFMTLI